MSRFNSNISVLGIAEPKVQQAILKLLENSLFQNELIRKTRDGLSEQIRRVRQKIASDENVAWAHVNVRLDGSSFPMRGLVSDASASYNVNVTFMNTTETARTCRVNGAAVPLAGGDGAVASATVDVQGGGTFTIDNAENSVSVFVRIWR